MVYFWLICSHSPYRVVESGEWKPTCIVSISKQDKFLPHGLCMFVKGINSSKKLFIFNSNNLIIKLEHWSLDGKWWQQNKKKQIKRSGKSLVYILFIYQCFYQEHLSYKHKQFSLGHLYLSKSHVIRRNYIKIYIGFAISVL